MPSALRYHRVKLGSVCCRLKGGVRGIRDVDAALVVGGSVKEVLSVSAGMIFVRGWA
jgi:hypothetical protein